MRKITLFTIVVCTTLVTSCTYRVTDFTIISTKNVDLSRAAQFKRTSDRIEGKDVVHIVLSIPLGRPNMKEAIDRAIETTKGAVALVDGVVSIKGWSAIVYGKSMVVVEGTPLIDPTLAMKEKQEKENYTFLTLDKNGKITNQKEISSEEYNKIKTRITKSTEKTTFKNSTELIAK